MISREIKSDSDHTYRTNRQVVMKTNAYAMCFNFFVHVPRKMVLELASLSECEVKGEFLE